MTDLKLQATAVVTWALVCASALQAHHSASMFEDTPIWVDAVVVRFDRINPHSITMLEERTRDGQVRRWAVEGPDPGQMDRRGIARDILKAGDVVRFCGFPPRDESRFLRTSQGTDGEPRRFLHGHVLVKNGQKSMWGSYGTLGRCIMSSGEPRQAWVDFLNSDARVQGTWCAQRVRPAVREDASSRAFVEEMTRLLSRPCE